MPAWYFLIGLVWAIWANRDLAKRGKLPNPAAYWGTFFYNMIVWPGMLILHWSIRDE